MAHKEGKGFTGHHHSDKSKKLISEANKENTPWAGKKHKKESILKMKASHKGQTISDEHLMKLIDGRKNCEIKDSTRKLLSEINTGKTLSDATRKKMSESREGKYKGDKCHLWKGGVSYLPYCDKFDEQRKKATRRFFGYCCIICGKHESENLSGVRQISLSVHHVDHDKEQGCSGRPFNLVPLCNSCHAKENSREEEYKKYINKTLEEGFKWGIWSRDQYEKEVMY
jgi:hypothetical protein